MQLVIFGGSFDPIHNGHVSLVDYVERKYRPHAIVVVPAYVSPFKEKDPPAPGEERLAMVKEALGKYPSVKVSSFELLRKRRSYTIDTVRWFIRCFNLSGERVGLLIGQDSLEEFSLWKEHQKLLSLVTLLVARRGPSLPRKDLYPFSYSLLDNPLCPISSEEIREKIRQGEKIDSSVPPEVKNLIESLRIYQRKEMKNE